MLQLSFWISFLSALFLPLLLPYVQLLYFLPYLVLCCYRKTYQKAVQSALVVGVLIDLLSQSFRFGMHVLILTSTVALCYPLKRHFFEDKPSTLPLLVFLFSVCHSLLSVLFFSLLIGDIPFNLRWMITDLFEMSICDALYGLLLFSIPFQLTRQISKLRAYALARKRNR